MKKPVVQEVLQQLLLDCPLTLFNQYQTNSADDPWNEGSTVRQGMVQQYIEKYARQAVWIISQAPGYWGARLTGIPLMDAQTLATGVLGTEFSSGDSTEISSKLMHEAIGAHRRDVFVWSLVPWHPSGESRTNRAPSMDEMQAGLNVLRMLIDHYHPQIIVGLGQRVHDFLLANQIDNLLGPHPYYDRATFVPSMQATLAEFLAETKSTNA